MFNRIFAIAFFVTALLLFAGCGGGGGGTSGGSNGGGGGGTTLKGKVLSNSGTGIAGVIVDVFDSNGGFIGSGTTTSTGAFAASQLTGTPAYFALENASVPAGYYKEYKFNNVWYASNISGCRAHITNGSSGTTTLSGTIQVPLTTSPPPPPPTGCTGS